jgi:CRP-like cAMP-binding protein
LSSAGRVRVPSHHALRGIEHTPEARNLILAALPSGEKRRLAPFLETVPLTCGQVLQEAGQPADFVYFPNSGLVYVLLPMPEGQTFDVSMVGSEGFLGIPVFTGMPASWLRWIVRIEGSACRVPAGALRHLLPSMPRLDELTRNSVQARIIEIVQFGACNSLHRIEQRLARLLLMSSARTESNLLPLTQDLLAQILGCRRSSITAAAHHLQTQGAIEYRRGQLRIVSRRALECSACECYFSVARYLKELQAHSGLPNLA